MLFAFLAVVVSYLIGSVNFAVIFTKIFTNKDVRTVGSGNAGSTNALRAGGKKVGILTFICDFAKGALAAFLGKILFQYAFSVTGSSIFLSTYGAYLCGLVCMIGHVFPIFFEFKGGKGVATGAGIFIAFCPLATVIGLSVFIICVIISKTVSLSSLIATVSVIVAALFMADKACLFLPQLIMGILMGSLIFIRHKDNIGRLIRGEENKFSFGGKKNV